MSAWESGVSRFSRPHTDGLRSVQAECSSPSPLPAKRRLAPELALARVLCNQLRRKRLSTEKKRIVHLICLNLLAVLKRPS